MEIRGFTSPYSALKRFGKGGGNNSNMKLFQMMCMINPDMHNISV